MATINARTVDVQSLLDYQQIKILVQEIAKAIIPYRYQTAYDPPAIVDQWLNSTGASNVRELLITIHYAENQAACNEVMAEIRKVVENRAPAGTFKVYTWSWGSKLRENRCKVYYRSSRLAPLARIN